MAEYVKIIAFSVVAAVIYGIIHDQITARICVEYFTIGHEPVFGTDDPTLLGLGWGVIATWWMGFGLGIPFAIACRAGTKPKIALREAIRPILCLLCVMAICATLAGVIGRQLASQNVIQLFGTMAQEVPKEKHIDFLTDLWAHNASYTVGFWGGIVLIIRTYRKRKYL